MLLRSIAHLGAMVMTIDVEYPVGALTHPFTSGCIVSNIVRWDHDRHLVVGHSSDKQFLHTPLERLESEGEAAEDCGQ